MCSISVSLEVVRVSMLVNVSRCLLLVSEVVVKLCWVVLFSDSRLFGFGVRLRVK